MNLKLLLLSVIIGALLFGLNDSVFANNQEKLDELTNSEKELKYTISKLIDDISKLEIKLETAIVENEIAADNSGDDPLDNDKYLIWEQKAFKVISLQDELKDLKLTLEKEYTLLKEIKESHDRISNEISIT